MTIREDILRAASYGKDAEFQAIRETKGYQTELEKVRTDFKGKSWIESPFKLPQFTDDEFEARRIAYQAKYGTTVNVPNANDIFHLKIPVRISADRMAAHNYAKKKKLPSPLGPDELLAIAGRRARFLRCLQSPTPTWLKNVSSILTFLDNTEDALITAAVLGRLALRAAPKLLGRLIPGLGWLLLGSDIINLANVTAQITWAANAKKRLLEDLSGKNPFHKKAWANRASRLKKVWPSFGEILEIAQTTDQMFGVGICLGSIMGLIQEVMDAGMETIAEYGAKTAVTIVHPTAWETIWAEQLKGAPPLLAGFKDLLKADYEMTVMTAESALSALLPWWFKVDPLKEASHLGDFPIRAPRPKNIATRQTLSDMGVDPNAPTKWPLLDVEVATVEELNYAYAPLIKEGFQTYALENQHDYMAMMTAEKAVDYYQALISALSDEGYARVGRTAYAQAAVEMARDVLQIPPDTPQFKVDMLSKWIGDYERTTGQSPSTKEIERAGRMLGINWDRKFPRITFGKAAEMFPEWRAIQDQLGALYVGD